MNKQQLSRYVVSLIAMLVVSLALSVSAAGQFGSNGGGNGRDNGRGAGIEKRDQVKDQDRIMANRSADVPGQGQAQGQSNNGRWGTTTPQNANYNPRAWGVNALMGFITNIDDETLTVSGHYGTTTTATTTYTVDVSDATIYVDNATSSVSDLETGDHVRILGTVDDTDMEATEVYAGQVFNGQGPDGNNARVRATSTSGFWSRVGQFFTGWFK